MKELPTSAASDGDALHSELVRLTQAGSSAAARELLQLVAPTIRAVVARFLGPGHREQEDWIQESMVAFIQALSGYRQECSIKHYARRVTLHRLLDRQKKANAQKRALDEHFGEEPEEAPLSPRQFREVESGQLRRGFEQILAELPREQSEAFAARHVLGYSIAEVAEAHEVSPNTVRSRLRLAKEALRRRIADDPVLTQLLGRPK